MRAEVAVTPHVVPASPLESAISAPSTCRILTFFRLFAKWGMVKRRKNRLCVRRVSPNIGVVRHKEGGFDGKGSSRTSNRYVAASRRDPGRQPCNGEEAVGNHSRRLRRPRG